MGVSAGAQVFDFGHFIKLKRQETGESQQSLAVALGVSRDAIIRWESGGNIPGDEYLGRMEKHWGLEPDFLLAQKFLNILELAKVDLGVIVRHAPHGLTPANEGPRREKAAVLAQIERLAIAGSWEALANFSMRKMRDSAVARTVHVLEDSMPADELKRRLHDAGLEVETAADMIEEPKPVARGKRKGKG